VLPPKEWTTNVTTHVSIPATIEELKATAEHLRNENADLRASALLWKRLYEQALSGAQ
jgi:ABC-type thiamine transport system substrate-binding protein